MTTFSDLTAGRRAFKQKVLRISEEKHHRGLVESLPLMVVQSDRAMRLEYANPAVRTPPGFELDEVADPAAWASRIAADDLPRLQEMGDAALRGQPGRSEYRYRLRTASSRRPSPWPSRAGRKAGAFIGVTTLMVDVTRENASWNKTSNAPRAAWKRSAGCPAASPTISTIC